MQKLLVAALAVLVLALGAAVPALAVQTQSWEERRIATEAFDAAADTALEASADSAIATAALADAREAAEPVLEDARAVAAAAPGYFNPAVLDPLVAAVAALDAALAAEAPDGAAMPGTERPESIEELRAGVDPLLEWANAEAERAVGVTRAADGIIDRAAAAGSALLALAETVGAEASAALGAAPLASPESRAAVEAARGSVLAAVEGDEMLADSFANYAAAVAALRDAQQSAEAAAADADSSDTSRGSLDEARERLEAFVDDWMQQRGCVPIGPDMWDCPLP